MRSRWELGRERMEEVADGEFIVRECLLNLFRFSFFLGGVKRGEGDVFS